MAMRLLQNEVRDRPDHRGCRCNRQIPRSFAPLQEGLVLEKSQFRVNLGRQD